MKQAPEDESSAYDSDADDNSSPDLSGDSDLEHSDPQQSKDGLV